MLQWVGWAPIPVVLLSRSFLCVGLPLSWCSGQRAGFTQGCLSAPGGVSGLQVSLNTQSGAFEAKRKFSEPVAMLFLGSEALSQSSSPHLFVKEDWHEVSSSAPRASFLADAPSLLFLLPVLQPSW